MISIDLVYPRHNGCWVCLCDESCLSGGFFVLLAFYFLFERRIEKGKKWAMAMVKQKTDGDGKNWKFAWYIVFKKELSVNRVQWDIARCGLNGFILWTEVFFRYCRHICHKRKKFNVYGSLAIDVYIIYSNSTKLRSKTIKNIIQ